MPKTLSDEDIQQFRENMRRVAENAFATRGAQGVTMRELAKELGCSAMTPYRYFRDKDDILAMVRAAAFNRFAARLEAAARETDAGHRGLVADAYVSFALDEPHAYRLMFDLTQQAAGYPELAAASQRAWRMLGEHFEQLVAAGILEGDPQLIGYVYWVSLHGFVMLVLANQLPLPQMQQAATIQAATQAATQPAAEPARQAPTPAAATMPTREAILAQMRAMLWRGALRQPATP